MAIRAPSVSYSRTESQIIANYFGDQTTFGVVQRYFAHECVCDFYSIPQFMLKLITCKIYRSIYLMKLLSVFSITFIFHITFSRTSYR